MCMSTRTSSDQRRVIDLLRLLEITRVDLFDVTQKRVLRCFLSSTVGWMRFLQSPITWAVNFLGLRAWGPWIEGGLRITIHHDRCRSNGLQRSRSPLSMALSGASSAVHLMLAAIPLLGVVPCDVTQVTDLRR